MYDYSEPKVYQTEVLNKTISKGRRSTTYYNEVAPWDHHYDNEEISVPRVQYEELSIGDKVNKDYKKGLFDIPWYFIEGKKKP